MEWAHARSAPPGSVCPHHTPLTPIIIKTTYDISLDFQDSLLPLGFFTRGTHSPSSHREGERRSRRGFAPPSRVEEEGSV